MNRLVVLMVLNAWAAALGAESTVYVQWSTKYPNKLQDWSGRAEISQGRIVKVKNDSGAMDKVRPDGSWTIVYGRSFAHNPKARVGKKGLWITVAAPRSAMVIVKTKGGDFSFRLDEIKKGGIERLDGNVRIYRDKPGRRRSRRPQMPPAKVLGEIAAERISDPTKQSEWPALAWTKGGALWAAYVEWDGKASDRIVVKRKAPDGTWGEAIALDDGSGDHYWAAAAAVGEGGLFVWSAQQDGNFDLHWAPVSADGKPGKVQRLTSAPHADFHARMAAAPNGDVVLAWQSFRTGHSDVYAAWFRGGRWGQAVRVSPSEANDWQPSVAVDRDGAAWIAWDSYEHGNYDVFLRRFDAKGLGPVVPITTEPTAQFHSTVAVDGKGRVWVAWDDAGINWGKDFSRTSAAPGSRGLHYSRTIALRVWDGEQLLEPTAKLSAIATGRMARYAELPRLAADGAGTLWLVFRHWTIPKPTEMYHEYAAKLTAPGWEGPWRLGHSGGRNTLWATMALGPDGALRVAYPADERSPDNLPKDQVHALIHGCFVAVLPKGGGLPAIKLAPVELPKPGQRQPVPPRPTMTVGGTTYTLVMGDCHRHTDIRGHSGVDGSILDTYRYALDAVPLDFLGMGDHNEVFGGRWPDGLRDYQWWWTQKAADLFHCPPRFIALYSYEHSLATPAGHRNLIFLKRGAPLRRVDRGGGKDAPANQPPELWKWVRANVLTQPGQKCVIVPHTFAAGPLAEWNWPNAAFDCLLEIYQGCRGSYEAWNLPPGQKRGGSQTKKQGHFAQDALARGNRYGFVSFSDHASTHNSFACVWVQKPTRESLLDAMLARRTYAATDQIILKVTADDHMVGESFDALAARPLTLRIEADAPDTILRVDIVKNGKYIWTRRPKARRFAIEFRDRDVQPGEAYYYVRLFQRDPEGPDGDPEIAWSSPFFVTYK